jgi:TRAP-type C4-dicarboxylate transport system substrate-binding protein
MDRRSFLATATAAVAAAVPLRHAKAAEVTLRIHHFLSPRSTAQVRFLEPWAERVTQQSDGRIEVQIFPAMQLGGAPPGLYDQARDGTVDLVWTLPASTPGRFPSTEAFELPFMPASAEANSQAIMEFGTRHLKEEFAETQPIVWFAHDPGLLHTVSKPVRTRADLQGLRIRFPTRLLGEALAALGATPVGMPIPEVPQALQQGVIDGAAMPWEVVPALKVHELTRHHTAMAGARGLYTTTFVFTMNKARYESLPDDLRAVIDANSGLALAKEVGRAWDENAALGLAAAQGIPGSEFHAIAPDELESWKEVTRPVVDDWLRQMGERGLDGAALIAEAEALIAKYAAS